MGIPHEFSTMRGEGEDTSPLVMRDGFDRAVARPLLASTTGVEWSDLCHAYGSAADVPAQLAAVIVGDDQTREEAWWNLWGNIHHQGTVYAATLPAVPVLFGLAGWREHPDRVQALHMLREISRADGVSVWRDGSDGDLVHDEDEEQRLFPALRAMLDVGAEPRLDAWRGEPEPVQRVLLWLLTGLPALRARHDALVAALLPERHRVAWTIVTAGSPASEEEAQLVFALEDWVLGAEES